MSRSCENIITPTMTSAAAATSVGTIDASGVTNIAAKNSTPVTRFARPVRAPSSMPAADSMNTVFDDADVAPPTTAPAPSTISAERSRGKVPRSSASPASRDRPVKVPIASKKFANTSVNTSMTAASTPMRPKLSQAERTDQRQVGQRERRARQRRHRQAPPAGLLDRRPEMPDRLDDDGDHGARHQPDEDAAPHLPDHENAGEQQREHEHERRDGADGTDAAGRRGPPAATAARSSR